jgi:flagellar hook-length control protein FliK
MVWLARNEQQSAQISITPPQLGPIQITLNLNGDQASAVFASPHAEVRQAIQDALPQLRDMLSAAGINLGQANVGSQMAQQGREFSEQFAAGNRSGGETAILPADDQAAVHSAGLPLQRGRGMVDLFA